MDARYVLRLGSRTSIRRLSVRDTAHEIWNGLVAGMGYPGYAVDVYKPCLTADRANQRNCPLSASRTMPDAAVPNAS